jgi:hypothetical protein
MSLKLNSSGGGSVTVQEPSTASALTLTLPTTTGTAVIQNASNNLLMNSGYGSDAVAYGCRAWVNFNGSGTIAIRASANVTSITDNGVGDYTVNLTNAMPDANYCVVSNHDSDSYAGSVDARATGTLLETNATTSFKLRTYIVGGAGTNQQTARDYTIVTGALFR